MQTNSTENTQKQFSIQELDQIESVIQATLNLIATLENRRETLTAELESITRPEIAIAKTNMKQTGPGLEYRGKMYTHWNYIDIHIDLLRRLWTDFPERREEMAKAMGYYGTTRAYVAKTVADLFPGQPIIWAKRFSRPLVDDWYVDTNLNRERMKRVLPAAVRTVGLKWGEDVKTYW